MTTQTISTQTKREHMVRISEPSVQDIIAKARAKSVRAPSRGAWLLSGTSALLLWASFTPLDWGPLGWIALVPLILLIRIKERTRWMYSAIYLTGFLCMLATLQWMRLGHQTMYVAWAALSFYTAMYVPAFVGLSRIAHHRFRVPLTLTVPVIWVGLELARAHLLTGFSWYYLAHTQYRWIELIQISDITGAYGVSFVIALTAATLAGVLPTSLFAKIKLLPPGAVPNSDEHKKESKRALISVAASLATLAVVLGYGYARRAGADFQAGPRVALVQGNFTSSVKHDPSEASRIFHTHRDLTGATVRHQPDLIVWPESMFRGGLYEATPEITDEQLKAIAPPVPNIDLDQWVNVWRDPQTKQSLYDRSSEAGAPIIFGLDAFKAEPDRYQHYNSALFVHPQQGIGPRYDKLHRVIFGEYIPLKESLPWLKKFTPFSDHFGIAAGHQPVRFSDEKFSYAPIICFEDTVPHFVRKVVASTALTTEGESKPVDCLVNLTNDGWFHGSSELDQHLITSVFRAVECRTPLVRAVNTGISAYIDGDGVILEPEVYIDGDGKKRNSMRDPQTGRWHKQLNAALVHPVPLDHRSSLYVRWGDWFSGLCCLGVVFVGFGGCLPRSKERASGQKQRL